MAQRPKAASLPSSASRTARVGVLGHIRGWSGLLRDPALPLLVVGALLIALLAYQPRFQLAADLTDQPNHVRMVGVYPTEGHGSAAQRWTAPRATLRFVGVGAGGYSVLLRFHGGAAVGAGRSLRITAISSDPLLLAELPVRPDWQEIVLLVPPAAVDAASGDLALTLEIPPMGGAGDDPRDLGVALAHVTVASTEASSSLQIPPWRRAAQLLLTVVLAFLALRLVGVASLVAALTAGALGLVWGLAVGSARLDAVLLLDIAQRVSPWVVAIAAMLGIAPRLIGLFRRMPPADYYLHPAVSCAVLLIFALRFGGLLHPQYIMIDQKLRANQLVNIAAGRVELVRPQLEQQYEWGTREPVPYSLITYDILVPLTWFWSDDDLVKAIAATSALLDATVPLLLWALLRGAHEARKARRDRRRDLEASFAALCYAALPVGYLFFHDGSFPTTIGLWFVVVALLAVRWLVEKQEIRARWAVSLVFRRPSLILIVAVVTLGLALTAYVTHLAFVPFLVGALAASIWLIGGDRRAAWTISLALVLAGFGGWLIYYREYTLTLIQRTIPAFVQQIAEQGSVGRDTDLLYATAVNSPLQHLQAHFRIWPAIVGIIALTLLLAYRRRRFVTHLGLAYALFIGATLVAERWFGLWNKHIAFAAPGIALLAGVGLAFMWRRGPVGRLICVALLGFLFWESTFAWGNRVLWYLLPPDAL